MKLYQLLFEAAKSPEDAIESDFKHIFDKSTSSFFSRRYK